MSISMKPVVLTSDGKRHIDLPDGATLDNGAIDKASLISTDAGNNLAVGTDGNLVAKSPDVSNIVSKDLDNVVKVDADNRLKVTAADVALDITAGVANNALVRHTDNRLYVHTVSSDTGNILSTGADSGALLKTHDLVSTALVDNLLTVNADDNKLVVDSEDIISKLLGNITVVSKQENNAIVAGSDNGAYLSKDQLGGGYTAGQAISINEKVINVNAGTGLKVNINNQLTVDADLEDMAKACKLVYKVVDKTTEEPIKATTTNYGVVEFATDAEIKGGVSGKVVDSSKFAELKTSITAAYKYKGSVENYADLPTTDVSNGDVYNVVNKYGAYPAGTNFAAIVVDGAITWDGLGGSIDSSEFVTKTGDSDVTGIITVPTPTTSSSASQVVNRTYVDDKVTEIVKTLGSNITMVDGGAADVDVDTMGNNSIVFYRADDNFTAVSSS